MVLVKNWQFFSIFILRENSPEKCVLNQEKVFYDIVDDRNAFLDNKNKKLKKVEKLEFFQRGLSMVLVKNWKFFQIFSLGKIGQKNVFYDILEGRNAFLDYKNKKLKKSKNRDFSKGVSRWFRAKTGNFSRFLFQGKQARKVCFTLLQKEKSLSRLQKQEFEKVEKLGFFQRGQSMVLVKNW